METGCDPRGPLPRAAGLLDQPTPPRGTCVPADRGGSSALSQSKSNEVSLETASSGKQRVATRDLVRIGQHWRRKTRARKKPPALVIRQVHRADRQVAVGQLRPDGELDRAYGTVRINFSTLRAKYELLDEPPTQESKGGKHGKK